MFECDIERVGSRSGVPLFRLWIMGGGSAGQTVVDGLALIPLSLWLATQVEGRQKKRAWPRFVELPGLNDVGLPRIAKIAIPDLATAERMYRLASRAALQTAYALLLAGGDEGNGDEH